MAYCLRFFIFDTTTSQDFVVLSCLLACTLRHSYGHYPFSPISPQLLSQIERDISHAYDHIMTMTIANTPTLLSNFLALLADDTSISTLRAIAKDHTRHFFLHHYETTSIRIPLQDDCT